jgi:hypothetical protein
MKRAMLIGLFAILVATASFAQVTDDFTITVTVNFIEFQLMTADSSGAYPGWAVGNMNEGETVVMTTGGGGDHIYVKNLSNVPLDFSAYSNSPAPAGCGYGTPTAWNPGAAAGTDIYLLELGKGAAGVVPATYTIIDGTNIVSSDLYYTTIAGESYHMYSRFTTPISASDGCPHNITVTIVAATP